MNRIITRSLLTFIFVCFISSSLLAAGIFDWFCSGGSGVKGSGEMVTETRELDSFEKIELSGAFDLSITVGEKQEVKLTFDDNLIDLIRTKIRGRTLKIDSRKSYSSRHSCLVEINVPTIERVSLSGSGDVEVVNLDGGVFSCSISGSGDMELDGEVDELEIRISGSGDIDARQLIAGDAEVIISGSGSIKVHAKENLECRVSGSGDIYYYGDPEHISTHVSGSGSIKRRK